MTSISIALCFLLIGYLYGAYRQLKKKYNEIHKLVAPIEPKELKDPYRTEWKLNHLDVLGDGKLEKYIPPTKNDNVYCVDCRFSADGINGSLICKAHPGENGYHYCITFNEDHYCITFNEDHDCEHFQLKKTNE